MGSNKNYVRKLVNDYCVLDTETTGHSFTYDRIIEVGILKIRDNQIVDKYNKLVNPDCELDDFIIELTGITNDMLHNQPYIYDIKDEIISFIGDDLIVGHNTSFDINFIKRELDWNLENEYTDTLQFSRKLYPEMSHHRLSDMVQLLSLSRNSHRSIDDCIATKELYDAIKEKIQNDNIEIKDLFYNKKSNHKKGIDIDNIKADVSDIDEDNFFYGKHCVFTGTLEKMVRKDAMQLVVNVGGILDKSVTKETNYLILGNNDYCSSIKDGKSSKQKKAEKLKLKGQDIEILDENTFYILMGI